MSLSSPSRCSADSLALPFVLLFVLLFAQLFALPLVAQRNASPPASRVAIDSFVVTVRDMAAWALVTPAAHIPVGALQDGGGNVESVVGASAANTMLTSDSTLVSFRRALGAGARAQRSSAIGMAYFRQLILPGSADSQPVLVVEVEHRSGYRANVLFPYSHTGESPEFGAPVVRPGALQEFGGGGAQKKGGATRRQPRQNNEPAR